MQSVDLRITPNPLDNANFAVAVDGAEVTDFSTNFSVTFAAGERVKLVTAKVTGDVEGGANRTYTFSLVTDDATQIEGTPGGIDLTIRDDDDAPLVLTALNATLPQQTEANLQVNSVQIDGGATVTEDNDDDGVSKVIVEVDVLNAAGVSRTGLSARDRISGSAGGFSSSEQGTDSDLPSELVAGNDVLVFRGSPANKAQAQTLVQALRFLLTADDDDVGTMARVRITLIPPDTAGVSQTKPAVTYTIPITPENDTAYTVATRTIEVDELEEGGGSGASTVTILTGVSAVESGETINGVSITNSNNSNSALFRVAPSIALSGAPNDHVVMVSFTLNPNQDGEYTFNVQIADSGDDDTVSGFSINVVGLPDAIDEELITIDFSGFAPGAVQAPGDLGDDYILVPGTGEMTTINVGAVTCISGTACASVSAAINRVEVADSVALGSFGTRVRWTVTNSDGEDIAVTTRTIYVAPPVGFDVGVVSVDSGQNSVDLPISVAVSPGAESFSIIGSDDLQASENALELDFVDGSSLSRDNHSAQVKVTGITSEITKVDLITTAKVRAPSDLSASPLITAEQLNDGGLFSIGNASVMLVARPPETPPAVVDSSSFRQTFDATERERSETTSDDISVPESTTARSGVYISVGRGIELVSDSPDSLPLSTEVTTAVGINLNTETGVFDYAIDLNEPGDIATALLRLSTAVKIPSEVYKFDGVTTESWGPFIATIGGVDGYDRVYSAPAPCPELNGSRQPDDSSGGDHGYAWNLAVLVGNNVRVGDECLLVQIQDGSSNDADDAVDGTIFDPIGLVPIISGGGGGGSMGPIWLLLLAFAMALPYGLRRRQSSPFISDL